MGRELAYEVFRLGRRKLFVEVNDEEVPDAQGANQSDFVPGRAEQMRR